MNEFDFKIKEIENFLSIQQRMEDDLKKIYTFVTAKTNSNLYSTLEENKINAIPSKDRSLPNRALYDIREDFSQQKISINKDEVDYVYFYRFIGTSTIMMDILYISKEDFNKLNETSLESYVFYCKIAYALHYEDRFVGFKNILSNPEYYNLIAEVFPSYVNLEIFQ